MTSHDVVARARRVLSVRKVGHAGTLDPMATGLLILGVGAATRLLGYVGGHDKTYEATIRLGQPRSPTTARARCSTTASAAALDDDAIRTALAAQTGPLQQVPSSVSAVKVDGRRSYDRVRAGETVELAPRSVTVHRLDVHRIERPTPDLVDVDVTVTCTAGTYIRAIARDAGAALGRRRAPDRAAAHRLRAVHDRAAAPVEDAGAALLAGGGAGFLGLTEAATTVFPTRSVTEEEARALTYGQRIPATGAPGPARRRRPRGPARRPGRGRRCHRPGDRRLPAGVMCNLPAVSTLDDRLDALAAQFAPLPGVLVAFSGGVDSGVVLAAAVRALGADRVVAATAVSPSLPATEREAAAAFVGLARGAARAAAHRRAVPRGLPGQRRGPLRLLQVRAGRRPHPAGRAARHRRRRHRHQRRRPAGRLPAGHPGRRRARAPGRRWRGPG